MWFGTQELSVSVVKTSEMHSHRTNYTQGLSSVFAALRLPNTRALDWATLASY